MNALVLVVGLGVGADPAAADPPCAVGRCEGGCSCGIRVVDCGCFRVAAGAGFVRADVPQDADARAALALAAARRQAGPRPATPPPALRPTALTSTCGCALTRVCDCWDSQCSCPACGRAKATPVVGAAPGVARQVPFAPAPPTTPGTAYPPWPGTGVTTAGPPSSSFPGTTQTGRILTPAVGVVRVGSTEPLRYVLPASPFGSGCGPNGCPATRGFR